MLQIITGMYFRDVQLNETHHRVPLYTNVNFLMRDQVDLSIGHLVPSTEWAKTVSTVFAHYIERLEAVRPDGSDEWMISTGGEEVAADLAAVLSFALNATFTTVRDKADRLIQRPSESYRTPNAADILPRTFTPQLMVVSDDELQDLYRFVENLVALNRKPYERVMRAIRRIVAASERVAEDPTTSYIDYVAALEVLSSGYEVADLTWDRLDPRKRKILDPALEELSEEDAERLRGAILHSERAGIKNRYVEFVVEHVRPSYFRQEAVGSKSPVRQASLRRLVAKAYDARSKSLHELSELAIGSWLLVGGARTAHPPGQDLMLTHEGLNGLARHVVRTYVERASTELDPDYEWRSDLPNITTMRLAPELYLGNAESMQPASAQARAGDFLELLVEALAERKQWSVDMRPALGRIENLLRTQRAADVRLPMLMIYFLWHEFMPREVHRPLAAATLQIAERELEPPSIYSYAIALLVGVTPPWTVDEWCELAEQRYEDLHGRKPVEFPARFDAVLWASVAEQLEEEGARDLAVAALARAVESAPGEELLLTLEQQYIESGALELNARSFLLGQGPEGADPTEE